MDIRSSEICAAIVEKGVNNTFIIKSKYTRPYEGFAEGEFLDRDDFAETLKSVVSGVVSSVETPVRKIYVGIPCEFTEVQQTDRVISFQSAQRISVRHLKTVTELSAPEVKEGWSVIRCGALYYVLSDKRRLLNPLGMVSDSLRARLSFFTCRDSFMEAVECVLKSFPEIREIGWLPQNITQGRYLFEPEKRDSYTILFDFGYISSTFSVICGDGVAFSEAFSVGIGHVAVLLMEALDIPYDVALALLKQVNLNAKDRHSSIEECNVGGKQYSFSASELRSLIREGLDGVCEMVETCIQSFAQKDLTGAPVYITGEGVGVARGAIEHLSSRLVTPMEVVAPKLPYYDKPQFSSLFSLMDAALDGTAQ